MDFGIILPNPNDEILLGYYNPDFQQYLFPLFSEEINIWKKKNICYSNYDKLIIINLLSNRSFKDIYQYPVFPILYKTSKIFSFNENSESLQIERKDILTKSKENRKNFIESINNNSSKRKIIIIINY